MPHRQLYATIHNIHPKMSALILTVPSRWLAPYLIQRDLSYQVP